MYANAQQKKSRLLFLVDASSSMTLKWNDGKKNRWDAARQVVLSIMDSMYAINNEVEFAVRVYGTEFPSQEKNCFDTKLEVPFNLQNLNQVATRLKYVTPLGSSPIAYSLQQASNNEFSNVNEYDYSFVLITDGGESCGGDVCDSYRKLIANKVKVDPYIIGLDTNSNLLKYYECLGQYVSVAQPGDISKAVKLIIDNNRTLLEKKKLLNINTIYSNTEKLAPATIDPVFQASKLIMDMLNSIKPKYTFKSIVNVPKASLLKKVSANNNNIIEPFIAVADNMKAVTLIPFEVKRKVFVPSTITNKRALKNISTDIEIVREGLALNTIPMAKGGSKKLDFKLITAKGYNNMKQMAIPNLEFSQPSTTLTTIASIQIVTEKLRTLNTVKAPARRSLVNLAIPEIAFNKTSTDITSLFAASTIKALPITFKNIVPKPRQLLSTMAIPIIGPEPSGAVAFIMEPMWSNQFRLSYTPSKQKVPAKLGFPIRKTIIPMVVAAKKVKPKPIINDAPPEYKIERTESPDTRVQVFFTDGMGKFYKTKPMVAIIDPNTQKNVKVFMRDYYGGEPEPVKLDFDGVFDFSVLGQKDIVMKGVNIEKNKLNKIILKVDKGTLIFTYANNRDRPVDHQAVVVRRFGNATNDGKQITMSCMEQKMFEPGDYYIELDILPKYGVATEISFGATTEIQIPQEGAMEITNTENIGPVTLYYEHGDKFEFFKTLNVRGNIADQSLYLRPGLYKASFVELGKPESYPPTVVDFQVRSNLTTSLLLKDYKGLMVTPDGTGKPIYDNSNVVPQLNIQTEKKK
jgi:hypothetical protein